MRPTLRALYLSTINDDAEAHEVLRRGRELDAEPKASYEFDPEPYHFAQELLDQGQVLSETANASAHAFMMLVDGALQELRTATNLSVYDLGPQIDGDLRLGRALWALANHGRHGAEWADLSVPELEAHPDASVLLHLGINPTEPVTGVEPNAARQFILRFQKPTYREFEDGLLAIGFDVLELGRSG